MALPKVTLTERDGALGVLPGGGKLFALAGAASSGPIDVPSTYAKTKDVISTFTSGPLVEAAAYYIERYRKPVVLVRTEASVLGSYLDEVEGEPGEISEISKTGTGNAEFVDDESDPLVSAQVVILFSVGGAVGTTGIVYQISLDNGQTWGPPQALGTSDGITVGATGAAIEMDAGGTIVAGDFISFTLTAPILASAGTLDTSIAGGSVPTIDDATHPNDDYEAFLRVVTGGTIGVAGITLQWSLDGGRTMSPVTALGTAASFIFPGSGGVKVDFSAGTLVAGDALAFPTVAPRWNTSELGTALDTLAVTAVQWELLHVVGPIDPDAFDVVDLKIAGMAGAGKYVTWLGSTRMPICDESEATYRASLAAAFAAKATTRGALYAGACKLTSGVSSRKYRRPVSFVLASAEAAVSEEVNIADVNLGSLVGVSIRDANGNPDEHDEAANPGLDDSRFGTLRTWDGLAGVYCTRPRIFSAEGSDFQLVPHRRVMNIALGALRSYMIRRLNKPVMVDKTSGFILEEEALDIESGARAVLSAALLTKPKASNARFDLSRTDNLLSTKKLTGQARITPLAYPEEIELDVGFENPALQVQAV